MIEIKILAEESRAEVLSDRLMELGALSAAIEDADADREEESPLYGEPGLEPETCAWPRSIVSILAEDDFDVDDALDKASRGLRLKAPFEVLSRETVENQDWVRLTQAQFPPMRVSDRLWIVPTWHELPDPKAINLRLDPGVAFGTGSHPTTHLCLKWLDGHVAPSDTVLDYGCGTGVLAIAAKLVGAASVCGTDIDPQAVEAARMNAAMNGVEADFFLPDEMKPGRFSVVVANILANPLKLLAPALLERVAPGGALVLSGVLAHQAEEVIGVYRAADPGVVLSVWQEEEGWVAIAGRRGSPD